MIEKKMICSMLAPLRASNGFFGIMFRKVSTTEMGFCATVSLLLASWL